jgi:hypothetical protein
MKIRLSILLVVCGFAAPLPAQWLKEPTRGIPRTGDGKPRSHQRRKQPMANLICRASGASTRAPMATTWSRT